MPVRRATFAMTVGIVAVVGWGRFAAAQDVELAEDDRFFNDKVSDEVDETLVQGSLTSTTFLHRETGRLSDPIIAGNVEIENASPINRIFTDLRGLFDARHIGGAGYDLHADARVRVTGDERFQSGTFGGNEYDLRELYFKRGGDKTDIYVGRQFLLDVAGVKMDGLRVVRRASTEWSYFGFGGLFPTRGSRSIEDDYPKTEPLMMGEAGERVLPITGGLGAGYRYQRLYGSFAAAAIVPRTEDRSTGNVEKPRIFVTSNGYWQQSNNLYIYHLAVIDLEGAGGRGLTNASIGVQYKPRHNVRLTGQVHRVDTETLNVQAQTRLEDPDVEQNALVQNNVEVTRISSEAARLGLSVAFADQRFELSTSGAIRRRPEIELEQRNLNQQNQPVTVTIAAAQSAELSVGVLDRRSIAGLRLGADYLRIFGVGEQNLRRSTSDIARLFASRELADGRAELELDATYLRSEDDNAGTVCNAADITTCYGTSKVRNISVGGVGFYRFKLDWFVLIGLRAGLQDLTTQVGLMAAEQPGLFTTTGFLRLAYRF